MKLMDYHTHHYRCGHATGVIEDYIREAVQRGLSEIGISEHFPVLGVEEDPLLQKLPKHYLGIPPEAFADYIHEIQNLREKYKNKIQVKVATEVAFASPGMHFERQQDLLSQFAEDFDYILCGIHDIHLDGGNPILFKPARGPDILRKYGERAIHTAYFRKMRDIVETGYFDVITHFDNHKLLWLPEEPDYPSDIWDGIIDLIGLIKSKGMTVEINTMGTRKRCSSQFPSDAIVKELIERGVPLTLSSDAHRPEHVGYEFDEFIEKAKPWGLTHLRSYERRKPKPVPL
jgi:histidinol-phosphatase (PHP family)